MNEYVTGSNYIKQDWGVISIFDASMGLVTDTSGGYPYQSPMMGWAATNARMDAYNAERERMIAAGYARKMDDERINALVEAAR